jgi:transcriptional regulator GlxA family with amidase domain
MPDPARTGGGRPRSSSSGSRSYDGQLPFAALLVAKQTEDALIGRCQEWMALNYAAAAPVVAMMRIFGLPERSFMRRFTRATGMSPLEYVHRLRIEEAKQMLETGDAPVEAVAGEVGYQDASFFSRLFRRRVGMTPAQYRRRFGSLRRALKMTVPSTWELRPSPE